MTREITIIQSHDAVNVAIHIYYCYTTVQLVNNILQHFYIVDFAYFLGKENLYNFSLRRNNF